MFVCLGDGSSKKKKKSQIKSVGRASPSDASVESGNKQDQESKKVCIILFIIVQININNNLYYCSTTVVIKFN